MPSQTPSGILVITADLFFSSKIAGTARQLGQAADVSGSATDALAKMAAGNFAAVFVDLATPGLDVEQFVAAIAVKPRPRLIAFASLDTMTDNPSEAAASDELLPHLLYRAEGDQARFATWALSDGHEALAVFTTAATAESYRAELDAPDLWSIFQPPRPQLLEILELSTRAGILYAALDPIGGNAKTLFDIPQVLAAAKG